MPKIETGLGDITWSAPNLLDKQVMEAVGDLIEQKGSLAVLQLLQHALSTNQKSGSLQPAH